MQILSADFIGGINQQQSNIAAINSLHGANHAIFFHAG